MEYITLRNNVRMPMEGFGVFQVEDAAQCERAVLDAIAAGYRLIDTAAAYFNEEAVGTAIRTCSVPRDELFITTKLWVQDTSYEGAKKAFAVSMEKLGLDYLDLYLIHQPFNDYYGAWRAMEELYQAGRIRAIGVSNFYPDRLADLCLNAKIPPMVNQVELHPFFAQEKALAVMKEFSVQPQAWGPLPKSVRRERMEENIDIWDFSLTDAEMAEVSSLDLGRSEIVDHHTAETVKWLTGWRIHD